MGGDKEGACWMEAQHFVDACLFEECDQVPGCHQRCEDRAQGAFEACLLDGVDINCDLVWEETFNTCLAQECN